MDKDKILSRVLSILLIPLLVLMLAFTLFTMSAQVVHVDDTYSSVDYESQ